MKLKPFIAFVLIILSLAACNKSSHNANDFDYGKVENGKYENRFFNLKIEMPHTWFVLGKDENQNLLQSESNTKNSSSDITTEVLLTAMQYEMGKSDTAFNANLIVLTENLKGNDRIRTAADYLMFTRKSLENQAEKREFPDNVIKTQKLDNTDFAEMKVVVHDAEISYCQKYLTSIINGFALTLIQTYQYPSQQAQLDQIIKSVRFEK